MLTQGLIESKTFNASGDAYSGKQEVPRQQFLQQFCHRQLSETVIRQYRQKLLSFLMRRVSSTADAQDFLQDVCQKISKTQQLGAWLSLVCGRVPHLDVKQIIH